VNKVSPGCNIPLNTNPPVQQSKTTKLQVTCNAALTALATSSANMQMLASQLPMGCSCLMYTSPSSLMPQLRRGRFHLRKLLRLCTRIAPLVFFSAASSESSTSSGAYMNFAAAAAGAGLSCTSAIAAASPTPLWQLPISCCSPSSAPGTAAICCLRGKDTKSGSMA
jgi:hypothetical protein